MPPTMRPTTASRPMTPPMIRTALPPFFLGLVDSSSSRILLFLAPGLAFESPLARASGLLLLSVSPLSASPGSSTTKRYLHFGQSTFLPMRLLSLIGTCASQLGQGTLNWVDVAIENSPESVRGTKQASKPAIAYHHTR